MKTFNTLLTLVLTVAFSLNAAAQDVAGTWQVESVSEVEPPEAVALTLSFGSENKATVTYTLSGESQSWQYTYAVADGQLTLEPASSFGEPQTVTYDIKLDEGKLLLLTPKPKPDEETGDEPAAEGEGKEGAEEVSEEADEADAEEETEKEEADTRVPVWVLVKG